MIKKFFILCISVLLLSSCYDFLEPETRGSLMDNTYFTAKEQIEGYVNGLIRNGPMFSASPGVYSGSDLMLGGWCAGMFDNLNYKGQEMFVIYVQEFGVTQNNMNAKMGSYFGTNNYQPITRCNKIIELYPTLNPVEFEMTQADLDRCVAEARFYRAQHYFFLVRHFGDVPLVLNVPDAGDELKVPRDDATMIYNDVIIPDLLQAIAVLPVRSQYNNGMRITAAVASAVLIDVYIQMAGYPIQDNSKWALAAAEAKKFLPGGVYASDHYLVQNEDFEELSAYNQFRSVGVSEASPGGRKTTSCPEFVYTLEFVQGITNAGFNANAWPMEVGALGTSECRVALTNNAYKPMPRYLDMYNADVDLRKKDRQFFSDYFDKRDGSFLYNNENNTPAPYFFYDYGAVKGSSTASGRHWALYRLAEMYLFAAEAIAQTEGVTAQAVDALASVRARAYEWGGITKEEIVAQLQGLSKEKFIEEVWLERYRELVFENKQWNQLQRTRVYPKTNSMDSSIPKGTAQFVDITTVGTDFSKGQNFPLHYLLWCFPESQLQRNPNLTQNPGYN